MLKKKSTEKATDIDVMLSPAIYRNGTIKWAYNPYCEDTSTITLAPW